MIFDSYERGIWKKIGCDERKLYDAGKGIASFSSLFNHSCYPDVSRILNDESQVLLYATRPIKKGSQVKKIFFNSG